MFTVKDKKTGELYQVLSVENVDIYGMTYFLVWKYDRWSWLPAKNFVPPKVEIECKKENPSE